MCSGVLLAREEMLDGHTENGGDPGEHGQEEARRRRSHVQSHLQEVTVAGESWLAQETVGPWSAGWEVPGVLTARSGF